MGLTLPDRSRATYLSVGENIDITGRGYLRRRRGQTSRLSGTAHSIWGDGRGDGYAVLAGDLVRLSLTGASLASNVLRAGVSAVRPMSFERFPDGSVVYSNQEVLGRILSGADGPVVTDPLGSAPVYGVIAGGLAAGKYMLVVTAVGARGESASTAPVQVQVPADGGIRVSGLPGTPTRIYMTGPNGEHPTLEIETSAASVDLVTHSATGIRCQTMNLASMPAGSIVRHYNSRLLVASGAFLFVSEPYYYGVCDPVRGYIPFPAPITIVQPVEGGVYVVADQTYWLAGNLESKLSTLLPYGAVPGTGGSDESTKTTFWLSDRGLIVADQIGTVKNVQEGALALAGGTHGAALYRERDGSKHIVTVRRGAEPITTAGDGWQPAELTRKETA